MRIVFGWNHFMVKSYTPAELGLPKSSDSPYSIELRQKYFHFFWIPFFAIGQKWTLRKSGKLFEVPTAMMGHIHQRKIAARTPWYTFAGPLLILAGIGIYGFSEKMDDVRRENYLKTSYENKAATLAQQLNEADNHDYFWLQGRDGSNVLLKATQVKGDAITASMITTGLSDYEINPMKIQYLFSMKGDAAEQVVVGRQRMLSSIQLKYADAGKTSDILGNGSQYKVKEIYHLDGPLMTSRGTGGWSNNSIRLEFLNFGWPGYVTKITNLSGDYTWTNTLPQPVGTAKTDYDWKGTFALQGTHTGSELRYKVEITMVDTLQKEHKYIVEGQEMDRTIKQIK